ncbi:MAG: DUF4270 family protein [Flavobacteriales bacterium]|nr:DUF4270 family protein [Flavobacteriales bacterium]
MTVVACRKPDPDQGLDILPGDPLGVVVDTFTLHAFTVVDSAVRTSGLSKQLAGAYMDPQFGLVKAGLVTQWRLPANNIGQGIDTSGLVADSLVLSLAFDGANYGYGNMDPQVFEAYELSESLSLDSTYHAYREPEVHGTDLVANRGGRIKPQPTSRPTIGGDTLVPQLRIRLDAGLAARIMDAFGTPAMSSSEEFLQFFKGIHVTVDPSGLMPHEGGVLIFDLVAAASKATLYYRDLNDTPELTRTLDLLINSNCVRYTVVRHDRSQAMDVGLATALADTTLPAATTYVQALGGLRTAIRFPELANEAGANRILAKAELVAPVSGSVYPFYPPPSQIFLFRRSDTGGDVFLPDQLNGIGAIDGRYRLEDQSYHFNITRYIQGVINGTYPNDGFTMVSGSSGVSANRVVLAGPAASDDPMKLRLTFTTY